MKKHAFPLTVLLSKQDEKTKSLFVKIINLHAGYKLDPITKKELLGRVKDFIEKSCKN